LFPDLTNSAKACLFFALAFGLTLTVSLLQPLLGGVTMLLHMYTPTFAAVLMLLVVTREGYTRAGWSSLGLHRGGWRSWGFALLAPLVAVGVAYGIVWMIGLAYPAMPAGFTPITLLLEIIASLVISIVFSLGEEIGFRAYLLPRLAHLGTDRALVLGGLMFGIWHFPLMLLTPLYPILGNWLIVGPILLLTLTAAGVFYGFLQLTSGSVWPATIAHGAVNTYFKMFGLLTMTSSPLVLESLAGERGVLTMIATALGAAWLISRLRRRPARQAVGLLSGT
jgi:membrane protease YdiL (CAAX protease family)